MAERKTTIYYNHNFYYDFSQIIAADDRGLQFGDGCYEWIRVYKGHPFALSYHTDRLYRSMRLLGIRPVTAPDEFTEIFHDALLHAAQGCRQGAGCQPQGWRGHAAGERPLP